MRNIKIKKDALKSIFKRLKISHRIIGPKIENNVIVLKEIDYNDIPAGYKDIQKPSFYRIETNKRPDIFSFSNGPDSFKRFLQPPLREVFKFKKSKTSISISPLLIKEMPIAFLGIRACDLSALRLYDRIFLEGPVRDENYRDLRKDLIIIAVNCLYPCDNCFCSSMGTGPEVRSGFDILITELRDSFILEINTIIGEEIVKGLPFEGINAKDADERLSRIEDCRKMINKSVPFNELPRIIYRNLEHPRWADIARRDLECGNCTQVCPTCFCNSAYDYVQISGISKKQADISGSRIRIWDSCFSRNFARVHGGNFRPSRRARYRHWMSHKLAYTFEQFGITGCVGCGRCITWCPAGIDITHEVEALKGKQ